MANEILFSFKPGATCYVAIFNKIGQVYRTDTTVFENYLTANYSLYSVATTQQGTSSPFYEGNFPTGIGVGDYQIAAKQQIGGAAAETDPTIATGNFSWNGTAQQQIADLATSGLVGQGFPQRAARGTMIQNFSIYMKSAADHITPFTSGIISGQIQRDASALWGPLQSGLFTETGNGYFILQALTSGDLLANSVRLLFTGVGISGGTSDPLPLSIITQRVSGQ